MCFITAVLCLAKVIPTVYSDSLVLVRSFGNHGTNKTMVGTYSLYFNINVDAACVRIDHKFKISCSVSYDVLTSHAEESAHTLSDSSQTSVTK